MATYQRPPVNPVVDAQRGSRWPIFLFIAAVVLAIGGGIAYEEYAANAPIVLTPKPSPSTTTTTPGGRASQPLSPSPQPVRPSPSKPGRSSGDTMEWLPLVIGLIPIIFIGVIVLVVVSFIRRRMRQAIMTQAGTTNPAGHWAGGQHHGPGETAAGPWARQPGTVTSTATTTTSSSQPVRRKGGGFPLLPIIVGAIILDQAVFNGRYSREVLAWITKFIEGFTR
jgi:hypothetical protein